MGRLCGLLYPVSYASRLTWRIACMGLNFEIEEEVMYPNLVILQIDGRYFDKLIYNNHPLTCKICFKFVYPEELARKVILITGASTGIGEHLAIEYAKEGACLILVARREKQLRMVAKNAKAVGSPDVIVIPADVSKLEDCNKIVDETIKHFGKIDYLINNAAIGKFGLFEDLKCLTDHTSVMDVNFWGSVYTTHFALPHLRKNKGKIIAICSCGGWFATPRVGVYNASKAALLSFYETLRIEFGSDVDILVVTPGMVETNLTDKDWLEEVLAKFT
ncbi:unnamed protein product [Lactuca saligna]|uniref:3-oxoacyl-[acyl-carrier-protein] reductase n=1 Tax=Lactuca saligna TaxID=75948 RepID=A0AA36E713_LACSI|nr:unnamed protein product [Lactuca saligna]